MTRPGAGLLDTSTVLDLGRLTSTDDLPLHTSNPDDVAGIDGLTVVPVRAP